MSHSEIKDKVKTWTPEYAVSLLERAVAEKGADYKDPNSTSDDASCRYFNPNTGQPECIVGHALAIEGVTVDDFWTTYNDEEGGSYFDQSFGVGVLTGYETPLGEVLRAAQRRQDNGDTWGNALEAARNTLEIQQRQQVTA